MNIAGRRAGEILVRLALGAVAWVAVSACACGGAPPAKVAEHVEDNCKTNLEMASADLKLCSAPDGKAESCDSVRKDVTQVAALIAKNKAVADDASAHVAACLGKTEADPECKATADAIAKLDCNP